jgi:hypothetical protein
MPGPAFAALAVSASAAIDAVMAEPFAFTPMAYGADKTAPPAADPSRAAATVNATFLDPEAKPLMPNSYDPREARRPGLESGTPRLWISPGEIANQAAGFAVQPGDVFLRQADGVSWRVSSVKPTAGGAIRCAVNMLG